MSFKTIRLRQTDNEAKKRPTLRCVLRTGKHEMGEAKDTP